MKMFGQLLGTLRRERNLSQSKVAKDLGISQALLSHYENGAREPKLDFVIKICDYYDISVDYVLGRDQRRRPPSFPGSKGFENVSELISMISETIKDLETRQNHELSSAAVDYLLTSTGKISDLLQNPKKTYDAQCDVSIKQSEAAFLVQLRKP